MPCYCMMLASRDPLTRWTVSSRFTRTPACKGVGCWHTYSTAPTSHSIETEDVVALFSQVEAWTELREKGLWTGKY